MNQTVIELPSGNFTTEEFLEANSKIELITIVAHEFRIGDVEDPDLWAGEPLWKWQQTEEGQWIMNHATETPIWNRSIDQSYMGYKYTVTAKLSPRDYTYWSVKWKKLD
jgi:hypothetical protein